METRIAIIGIIVYSKEAVEHINELLHTYSEFIIGRMGLPYREKELSVITVVMDAPNDIIGALSGKLGRVKDITVKTVYSKAGV
ncbi:MAG: iron-only hydrogenase system regulator [bacterium]|nr:iron-only hydrogenase system regulator [bacterium]